MTDHEFYWNHTTTLRHIEFLKCIVESLRNCSKDNSHIKFSPWDRCKKMFCKDKTNRVIDVGFWKKETCIQSLILQFYENSGQDIEEDLLHFVQSEFYKHTKSQRALRNFECDFPDFPMLTYERALSFQNGKYYFSRDFFVLYKPYRTKTNEKFAINSILQPKFPDDIIENIQSFLHAKYEDEFQNDAVSSMNFIDETVDLTKWNRIQKYHPTNTIYYSTSPEYLVPKFHKALFQFYTFPQNHQDELDVRWFYAMIGNFILRGISFWKSCFILSPQVPSQTIRESLIYSILCKISGLELETKDFYDPFQNVDYVVSFYQENLNFNTLVLPSRHPTTQFGNDLEMMDVSHEFLYEPIIEIIRICISCAKTFGWDQTHEDMYINVL